MPGYDRSTKEIVRTFAVVRLRRALPEPAPPVRARRQGRPTRPRPRSRRAACPTTSASATSAARVDYLRALPDVERQGRRDRLLLGRPPGVRRRVQPRRRRRRRLLRRARRRRRPRTSRRRARSRRSTARPTCAARCSGCSAPRTPTRHPSRSRADRSRAAARTARRTSSTRSTTRATRSSRSTAPTTASTRPRRAGSSSGTSSAATCARDRVGRAALFLSNAESSPFNSTFHISAPGCPGRDQGDLAPGGGCLRAVQRRAQDVAPADQHDNFTRGTDVHGPGAGPDSYDATELPDTSKSR